MTPRLYLESQLIGAALFSPGLALDVLDTLSELNFKEPEHRKLMQVLAELSASGELSYPQIVLRWMKHSQKTALLSTRLGEYTGGPVMPLALELLELDMREKFATLLIRLEKEKSTAEEFEVASAIKQTRDYLAHPAHDIFESVDRVGDYLRSYLAPEDMQHWDSLANAIPKLVKRIKIRSKTQTYLSQLLTLPATAEGHNQKTSLEIIAEITTNLLSRREIPQHVVSKLYDLKNNLWETPKSNPSPNF